VERFAELSPKKFIKTAKHSFSLGSSYFRCIFYYLHVCDEHQTIP
jgi:hypothetical protein